MNRRWQELSARFAALPRRERLMLFAAVLLAIAFALNLAWLAPALSQRTLAAEALAQKEGELRTLRAQLAALRQQAELERVQGEAALLALRSDYQAVSDELGALGRNLVAAREMPAFLRNVMPATRALEVVGVRTLAVAPLLPTRAAGGPGNAADGKPGDAAAADPGNLYRHSVEIRLAGNYADLHAWVLALEAAPKKVLWGSLSLEVQKYPLSVLTLTVHTLSLDRAWLSI